MVVCDPPEVLVVVGRCGLEAGGATSLRDCIAKRLARDGYGEWGGEVLQISDENVEFAGWKVRIRCGVRYVSMEIPMLWEDGLIYLVRIISFLCTYTNMYTIINMQIICD